MICYISECQLFEVRWTLINDTDTQDTDTTNPKRNGNRKWWLLSLVAGLIIGGTVLGLSVHFTKMPVTSTRIAQTTLTTTSLATTTTNKPAVKDHVLMLSTVNSTNVPMVIGLKGEFVWQFYCFIFILAYNMRYKLYHITHHCHNLWSIYL